MASDSMTTKTIKIDGQDILLRATARTPRLYREKFGRDLMQDMEKLRKAYGEKLTSDKDMTVLDLTVFENVAYIMAKQGNKDIPDDPDEWLDGFGIFSIFNVLPEILDLWGKTAATTSEPKKK